MSDPDRTTIVILGAGKGGTALLELFSRLPEVEIVGIADREASAPGLQYADRLSIPTTQDLLTLIRHPGINLIVNVTGDPDLDHLIAAQKHPETEALGGAASKVLWDLVQHESQMQAQLFQAEKLAGMGTFASGIAHDINNPLYILLAFAENIREETDLATIHEQAKSIIDAGKRIQSICQNITQYARAAKARDATLVEVNTTLDEALKIAQFATILQDLSIVRNYEEHLEVLANPDELFQVFVNLMTNAIHAMEGKGTLSIASWRENGLGKISIADTGHGISKEHLQKIFDPFFTTKPEGEGTGLGLHNARAIVKKYQGELSVVSEVGKGTTFIIELPNSATQ
ncbi:MAG: hypothetical protein NPIRA02_15960 [Nitrospirales bacterium]|nr:MAG: hypothetical protein NPIRA02_15960 [Nitrospirales bacterium]